MEGGGGASRGALCVAHTISHLACWRCTRGEEGRQRPPSSDLDPSPRLSLSWDVPSALSVRVTRRQGPLARGAPPDRGWTPVRCEERQGRVGGRESCHLGAAAGPVVCHADGGNGLAATKGRTRLTGRDETCILFVPCFLILCWS